MRCGDCFVTIDGGGLCNCSPCHHCGLRKHGQDFFKAGDHYVWLCQDCVRPDLNYD